MADYAAHIVGVVRRLEHVELDYSVGSLLHVDGLLGQFHDAGDDPGRISETLFEFGAYIGEVIVRERGGAWITVPKDHPLGGHWPLVELPGERLLNPIGKAFKRVQNGATDSITFFYEALATDSAG